MPFPDSESPEEGDTALGKDGVDIRGGQHEMGDEGGAEKVQEFLKLQVDGTLRSDMEEKVGDNGSKGVEIKSGDQGNIVKREEEESDDKDCQNAEEERSSGEEEDDGREEDANVRNILDKYLPLLERVGAGVNQTEDKCESGQGEEVENNRNPNQEELEDGVQGAEVVVNQVDVEDISEEKIEDESTEIVTDKEDISEDKTADEVAEAAEIIVDKEDICEEKTGDGSMEVVIDNKNITSEEKSPEGRIEAHCEEGRRMKNAREGGENPGGILTNLIFGNFDSKGRYCRFF